MTVYRENDGSSYIMTPDSDVVGGDVLVDGDGLISVVISSGKADRAFDPALTGVFKCPKDTGSDTAIAKGKKVYWDSTNKILTETSSGNDFWGKTVKAATDDDEYVYALLIQQAT